MERLRAVLVGCGRISATWLTAARALPDVEIVGLVDVREDAARARAAAFSLPDAAIDTDLDSLLSRLRPDLVFDCTAPEAHVLVRLAALRHGCHVLGEKPLADSLEGGRRIVAAGKTANCLVAVTQNRRYHPHIRRLGALVASGAIGPLTALNSDHYMGNHFGGFRETMRHPLLLDMAIHTFDAARYIAGADAMSVYCREWNPAGSWYGAGASAVAVFTMAGDVVFTYRGSWCAEGIPTSPDCAWRLVGQTGSAMWDSFDALSAQRVARIGGIETTGSLQSVFADVEIPEGDAATKGGGHASVMREFIACVRTGATPETVAADNLRSLAMVFAAIESAERGQPVPVIV